MLTRRQMLAGTAAGSIAAIASARGVAAAGEDGFSAGFGALQDGAVVAFHKDQLGFSFFLKLDNSAAQIFYKEEVLGQIGVFLKLFPKIDVAEEAFHKMDWQLVDSFSGFLKDAQGAAAGFHKVDSSLAQIFLKYENTDQQLTEDVRTLQGGLLLPGGDACTIKDIG
jgi:hypothetical protein